MEKFDVYFSLLEDWRNPHYTTYDLKEIMFLLVCGMLCGLRDFEEIADFAEEHWAFFSKYIDNHRPPCESTLSTAVANLNPARLELCLQGIFRNVFTMQNRSKERQICIDGKTICGANSIHIVTAMLADERWSLGQLMVDEKTNEIPIVQELLELINIKGAVVTMDAMHCQRHTMRKIIEQKGDYVVQVKKNHRKFFKDIANLFEGTKITEIHETTDKNHGRTEKRTCQILPNDVVFPEYFSQWIGLKKIFRVMRKVDKNGEISEETSYYISSKNTSAGNLLSYTRKHWQIESFHWILDVVCGEDSGYTRDKNSQFCMNIMRKYAVSMMRKYIENTSPKKKAISANMRKCLFNTQNLENVLAFFYHLYVTTL